MVIPKALLKMTSLRC